MLRWPWFKILFGTAEPNFLWLPNKVRYGYFSMPMFFCCGEPSRLPSFFVMHNDPVKDTSETRTAPDN